MIGLVAHLVIFQQCHIVKAAVDVQESWPRDACMTTAYPHAPILSDDTYNHICNTNSLTEDSATKRQGNAYSKRTGDVKTLLMH